MLLTFPDKRCKSSNRRAASPLSKEMSNATPPPAPEALKSHADATLCPAQDPGSVELPVGSVLDSPKPVENLSGSWYLVKRSEVSPDADINDDGVCAGRSYAKEDVRSAGGEQDGAYAAETSGADVPPPASSDNDASTYSEEECDDSTRIMDVLYARATALKDAKKKDIVAPSAAR